MNPSLYQINIRTFLSNLGRQATLDDIPDLFLDRLAQQGFDWLWPLGIWSIGTASRSVSRSERGWRDEYLKTLPDLCDADIGGSPFAITAYCTDPALGGDEALARLRARLADRGIKLLVDFVPNHVALDHPWVNTNTEFLIEGDERSRSAAPDRWITLPNGKVFAYGRDPNYPGWPDTLQLNYLNPLLREAMTTELRSIATRCDGVRCDMAMLLEPEIFARTWAEILGCSSEGLPSFWPAAIKAVRQDSPKFLFMAEVYWGYEWKLQQHGFDYTYDKTFYDRLLDLKAPAIREHLAAPRGYQMHMARFLENHDESRIAAKLPLPAHRAAAILTFLAPGLRFFHDGQLQGSKVRVPVHLHRAPRELPCSEVAEFYKALLPIVHSPAVRSGAWHMLEISPAWAGNPTHENFICYLIEHPLDHLLVVVNYTSYRGQCLIKIPERSWLNGSAELRDKLSHERCVRSALDLSQRGLFIDAPEWGVHIFSIECYS